MLTIASILVLFHPDQEWGVTVITSDGVKHNFADICASQQVLDAIDGLYVTREDLVLLERAFALAANNNDIAWGTNPVAMSN